MHPTKMGENILQNCIQNLFADRIDGPGFGLAALVTASPRLPGVTRTAKRLAGCLLIGFGMKLAFDKQ